MRLASGSLLLLLLCGLWAEDGAVPRLPEAIAHLIEAQAQAQGACAAANLTIPPGLNDVLVVRRTIAADWQRRLAAGEVRADDAGLVRFTSELESLVSGLQGLTNLAQQLSDAPRRFPHCVAEPAFARYRTLISETFAQGMQALVTGRGREQAAPAAWFARQTRFTALLNLIEAQYIADERYASLPRDDHWLVEYREHLLLTRTTLERTLDLTENPEGDHHQAIHDAYVRLLDLRVEVLNRIAGCGLPAEAPEVQVFRQIAEQRIAALGRHVALAHADNPENDEQWRQVAQEDRQLSRAERFTGYAERWFDLATQMMESTRHLTDSAAEAPAEQAAELRKQLDATTTAYREAQAAFTAAVTAGDLAASLAATQAGDRVQHDLDRRLMYLDDDLSLATREQAWRKHANDPVIAEKLHEWDLRRAALLATRRAADEASAAALAANQAAERAELASSEADERAAQADEAVDRSDLSDLSDALDEMVELRAGAVPAQ
jgi:hypothetical protein